MAQDTFYLAVDLGAESGRVIRGSVDDARIAYEVVYRFANGPADVNGSLKWDFEKLFGEILTGLEKAISQTNGKIAGIAVDSWGVDFGLIGRDGVLLDNPYHYRDSRTDTMMDYAFGIMPKREVYQHTGLQFMQFNSLYQILAYQQQEPELFAKADKMIMMADLVAYHLCGEAFVEYSLGSTSQMMDMAKGTWSKAIFETFKIPESLMPRMVKPGTVVGKLKAELAKRFKCEAIPVIAVGSHDTASAIAAVPAAGDKWAYLSSGTWSLLGAETKEAVINDTTFGYQFTNEGGVSDTIRLLKNIMGLWIVQECRRDIQSRGQELSYDEITRMADEAEPFKAMLNPNDNHFFAPGNMIERINAYMQKTGQAAPLEFGEMVRVTLESLAFYYSYTIDQLEDALRDRVEVLHIVGGGSQNKLLNQFAANALGRKVVAGPVEATALGNISLQAIAAGQLESVGKARELIARSFELETYYPQDTDAWQNQYEKFKRFIES